MQSLYVRYLYTTQLSQFIKTRCFDCLASYLGKSKLWNCRALEIIINNIQTKDWVRFFLVFSSSERQLKIYADRFLASSNSGSCAKLLWWKHGRRLSEEWAWSKVVVCDWCCLYTVRFVLASSNSGSGAQFFCVLLRGNILKVEDMSSSSGLRQKKRSLYYPESARFWEIVIVTHNSLYIATEAQRGVTWYWRHQ